MTTLGHPRNQLQILHLLFYAILPMLMLLYYCMYLACVSASIYCHSVSVIAMPRYCMVIMTQVGN